MLITGQVQPISNKGVKLNKKQLIFIQTPVKSIQIALHFLYRVLAVNCICLPSEGGHVDGYLQVPEAEFLFQGFSLVRVKKDFISWVAFVNKLPLVQIIQHVGSSHFFLHKHIGKKQVIGHQKISHNISHAVALLQVVSSHAFQRSSMPHIQIDLSILFNKASRKRRVIDEKSGFGKHSIIKNASKLHQMIYP